MNLEVLFEDNHCLAVNKPAGLLSQGDVTGEPSLVEIGGRSISRPAIRSREMSTSGLLHRLDRPTSGVVLLAKTSKAAGRLSEQFRSRVDSEALLGHRGRSAAAICRANGSTGSPRTHEPIDPAWFRRDSAAGKEARRRVPCRGAVGALYQARATARDRPEPSASRPASESRIAHPR